MEPTVRWPHSDETTYRDSAQRVVTAGVNCCETRINLCEYIVRIVILYVIVYIILMRSLVQSGVAPIHPIALSKERSVCSSASDAAKSSLLSHEDYPETVFPRAGTHEGITSLNTMDGVVTATIIASTAPGGVASSTESSFENTPHNLLLEISRRTSPAILAFSYLSFSRHVHVGERPGGT
jgi:hypothetical protein